MEHFAEKWMSIYSWRSFDNLIAFSKFFNLPRTKYVYLPCWVWKKRPLNSTYISYVISSALAKKSKLKCNGFIVSNRNVCIIYWANIWHFKRNSQLHGICSSHKSFKNRCILTIDLELPILHCTQLKVQLCT